MSVNLKSHDAVGLAARMLSHGPLVSEALRLASYAHDGQFRKECRVGVEYKDPYIAHPMRNALRVARFTEDRLPIRTVQNLVVSSLLHDTVEDVAPRIVSFYTESPVQGVSREQALLLIEQNFGNEVFDTVLRVTNPVLPEGMSKEERNKAYVRHLLSAVVTSESAWLTKASDLIDNAGSLKHMCVCDKQRNLAAKYNEPVSLLLGHRGIVRDEEVRNEVEMRLAQVSAELLDILEG